jgi:hypothetical protein
MALFGELLETLGEKTSLDEVGYVDGSLGVSCPGSFLSSLCHEASSSSPPHALAELTPYASATMVQFMQPWTEPSEIVSQNKSFLL